MAKKKTTKKGGLLSFFSKKKSGRSSKKKQPTLSSGVKIAASIIAVTIIAAGGAIGLIYMDRSVRQTAIQNIPLVTPVLVGRPDWIANQQVWIDKLTETLGGDAFAPTEATALLLKQRLETLSWMTRITVQTTPTEIKIFADYRQPVGLVDLGRNGKYYLDKDVTVLEYLPISSVPVIEITGIEAVKSIPAPGNPWRVDDAAAAVQILDYLYRCDLAYMDEKRIQKPLLNEIVSIDVENFDGRKSSSPDRAHIGLKVKDGTLVKWGAAIEKESVNFEAKTEIKRKRLYQHFIDHGNSLQGSAKYIELRQL